MNSVPQANPLAGVPAPGLDLDQRQENVALDYSDAEQRMKEIESNPALKTSGLSTQEALNVNHRTVLVANAALAGASGHAISANFNRKMQLTREGAEFTKAFFNQLLKTTISALEEPSPEKMNQRMEDAKKHVGDTTSLVIQRYRDEVEQADSSLTQTLSDYQQLNSNTIATSSNLADALHTEAKKMDEAEHNKKQLEQSLAYDAQRNAAMLASAQEKDKNLRKREEIENDLHAKRGEQAIQSSLTDAERKDQEVAQSELKIQMEQFEKQRSAAETFAKNSVRARVEVKVPKIVKNALGKFVVVPGVVKCYAEGFFGSKRFL